MNHYPQVLILEYIHLHLATGEIGLVVVNISDKEEIIEIELKNIDDKKLAGVFEIYNKNPNSRKNWN